MESVTVWVACAAAVLSILVTVLVTLAWRSSARRTGREIAELRALVTALDTARPVGDSAVEPQVAQFLITEVGSEPHGAHDAGVEPSSRLVLSATIGEPLVRMTAFAYGLRRALTPENRNRIRFEMRREIRRARKARRAAGRAAAAETRSQAVGS